MEKKRRYRFAHWIFCYKHMEQHPSSAPSYRICISWLIQYSSASVSYAFLTGGYCLQESCQRKEQEDDKQQWNKKDNNTIKKWRINKQQSTIQFTETWRLSNMNPMKTTVLVQGLRKSQQLYVHNWSWHPFLMAKLKSIQWCMLK